jgi:nucleoside-diphosphate-sugar epimerase
MSTNRREFVRLAAGATGALGLGLVPRAARGAGADAAPSEPPRPPERVAPLKILVLGGTSFIGPHQVKYAMERGHTITLFNRGRTNTQLFPTLEKLHGDRDTGDLASLKGRTWDAVIDNSATKPEWVRDSATLLKDSAKQYLFISTRSVYFDTSRIPMTSDAQVFTRENTKVEPGRPLPYGLAKAESEKELRKAFGNRATIVRPGLIIGPGDDTDRFSYWPVRIDRGGEVLCPGDPSDPVQIIDARDLSEWVVRLVEQGTTGTFNGVGPKNSRSMAELLYGIRAVTDANTDITFTWVDTDFLLERKVRPYADLPVWMPPRNGREGFARFDISPEIAAGLRFRPLAVTAKETLEWFKTLPPERQAQLKAGLTPEKEKALLAEWHTKKG